VTPKGFFAIVGTFSYLICSHGRKICVGGWEGG
jgi:hypothetical protein